jgi:hypothetical protein
MECLLSCGAYLFSSKFSIQKRKIEICRTVILPVVLYRCKTWSVTLREEHRLRVFENRVLREIFGRERDEATREWKRLYNQKLHDLYSSQNIFWVIKSSRIRCPRHVAHRQGRKSACRVLVGRHDGKRPLGARRLRWEDNIKIDVQEVGWGGVD